MTSIPGWPSWWLTLGAATGGLQSPVCSAAVSQVTAVSPQVRVWCVPDLECKQTPASHHLQWLGCMQTMFHLERPGKPSRACFSLQSQLVSGPRQSRDCCSWLIINNYMARTDKTHHSKIMRKHPRAPPSILTGLQSHHWIMKKIPDSAHHIED